MTQDGEGTQAEADRKLGARSSKHKWMAASVTAVPSGQSWDSSRAVGWEQWTLQRAAERLLTPVPVKVNGAQENFYESTVLIAGL